MRHPDRTRARTSAEGSGIPESGRALRSASTPAELRVASTPGSRVDARKAAAGPDCSPRRETARGSASTGMTRQQRVRLTLLIDLLGSEVRTADRAAADHGWWVFLAENLEQLGSSVGLERVPRVFGQISRVTRPGCPADLDHHARGQVSASDLPQPATGVSACGLVPAEVGADLPAAYVRR